MIKIYPSILSADFTSLRQEIESVERGGADGLHLDVMDGQFVPNLTFGPLVVDAVNRMTGLPLNVHLMVRDPMKLAERYVRAGADTLIFHVEAVDDLPAAVEAFRKLKTAVGISLNPETPLERIAAALPLVDEVLVMSVHPGFGGQSFIPGSLAKVAQIRKMKTEGKTKALISIDGGINRDTARQAVEAGANILVAGAAVFGSRDRAAAIREIRG